MIDMKAARKALAEAGWRTDMENAPAEGYVLLRFGDSIPGVPFAIIGCRITKSAAKRLGYRVSEYGWLVFHEDPADHHVWDGRDATGWALPPDQPDPLAAHLAAAIDALEAERAAIKRLCEIILTNDLNEQIADSGETVLDALKSEAKRWLALLENADAE